MTFTLIDLAVLLGELVILAIAYFILWWVTRVCFKRAQSIPRLQASASIIASSRNYVSNLIILLWGICSLFLIGANVLVIYRGEALLPFRE
ncbi:MAG: hypothetical protein F6K16_41660 [Symploca sp. SIO2B6]|nr:hypothetical protein [Symploca sp. SIO2B6]